MCHLQLLRVMPPYKCWQMRQKKRKRVVGFAEGIHENMTQSFRLLVNVRRHFKGTLIQLPTLESFFTIHHDRNFLICLTISGEGSSSLPGTASSQNHIILKRTLL